MMSHKEPTPARVYVRLDGAGILRAFAERVPGSVVLSIEGRPEILGMLKKAGGARTWTPMRTSPETTGFYLILLDSDVTEPSQRLESRVGGRYPIRHEVAFFDKDWHPKLGRRAYIDLYHGLKASAWSLEGGSWTTLRSFPLPRSWKATHWRSIEGP